MTSRSISVLKDASAAGIYGAAGSTNGVVQIITKHGSKGKTQTNVTAYTGMQQILKKLPVLNGTQYLSLPSDEYTNAGSTLPSIPSYLNANTNWQNLVYHTAMQTGANANFSGGSSKGTWFLGMGYLDQDGIASINLTSNGISVNLEAGPGDEQLAQRGCQYFLQPGLYCHDSGRALRRSTAVPYSQSLTVPPIVPVKLTSGVYAPNFDGTNNPVGNIYDNINNQVQNNMIGNVHVDIVCLSI